MREWLFNVMRELAERDELSPHYKQLEKEAQGIGMQSGGTEVCVWLRVCQVNDLPIQIDKLPSSLSSSYLHLSVGRGEALVERGGVAVVLAGPDAVGRRRVTPRALPDARAPQGNDANMTSNQ